MCHSPKNKNHNRLADIKENITRAGAKRLGIYTVQYYTVYDTPPVFNYFKIESAMASLPS